MSDAEGDHLETSVAEPTEEVAPARHVRGKRNMCAAMFFSMALKVLVKAVNDPFMDDSVRKKFDGTSATGAAVLVVNGPKIHVFHENEPGHSGWGTTGSG